MIYLVLFVAVLNVPFSIWMMGVYSGTSFMGVLRTVAGRDD